MLTPRGRFSKIFMQTKYKNTTLRDSFFKPIFDLYSASERQYCCTDFSDLDFIEQGLMRCLGQAKSARDFVQELGDVGEMEVQLSTFLKSLKSERRLENLVSVNALAMKRVNEVVHDPFGDFAELKDWEIYAVDGHYQKAACHDPKVTNKKGDATSPATGHFFRLNLRTHAMSLFETMNPDHKNGKKAVHDAKIIQNATPEQLRHNAPEGKKVMLVWDRACIDYFTWYRLSSQHNVFFMTQEKKNSAMQILSTELSDLDDPRNEGILSDTYVGNSNGTTLRRIIYKNPADGKEYRYITNELELPAYLLVAFYKHRWDIEKVYYQFKTKLEERKSWATGHTSKKIHGVFQALLHNLMLLSEKEIEADEELVDEVSEDRAKKRKRPPEKGFINSIVQRATHRTFIFIRWLRNSLRFKLCYRSAVARLKDLYYQDL